MSAAAVSYNLHALGWSDFQSLCGTIAREIMGQTVQRFSDVGDGGRDGAFFGTWKSNGDYLRGNFVIQCKFSARSDSTLQFSDLTDELPKATVLARRGLAKNYIIFTNSSVRATAEATIRNKFESIPGLRKCLVFDGNWITQQIREHKRLRILVPRVYGLGDLSEILDERVYDQAKEVLSWLGDELSRFVVTEAHQRSVRALQEKKFVLLLGDAGSGKSTIAAALALAAADSWKSRVVKVNRPSDFQLHWNPNETSQFFWVDDVFGQLKYENDKASQWNQLLPELNSALKRGSVAIFTSRRYIYKDALEDLKESAFPLLTESQVVIHVEDLSNRERQQILYNHIRLGNQTASFRRSLKPFLEDAAASPHFLPEIARRLGTRSFAKSVLPLRDSVLHFFAHPEQYLKEQFEKMSDRNRAALALVFMKNGSLRAPLNDLSSDDARSLLMFNSTLGEVRKSLPGLEGPYIARQIHQGETFYRFKHPTLRDGFGKFIASDPNLMDCYLQGTTTEMMLQEVTCGETSSLGEGLLVPPDRYHFVIKRLSLLVGEPEGITKVVEFLNSRASDRFITEFLQATPRIFHRLEVHEDYLEWSPSARLLARLHSIGILAEHQRLKFVEAICRRAILHQEWRIIRNPIFRGLLTPVELRNLRRRARRHFTQARLSAVMNEWKESWEESKEEAAEDYFWRLKSDIRAMSEELRATCQTTSCINTHCQNSTT